MRPKFDGKWDHRNPDEIRQRQIARLRRFLATRVLPFSPHYRKTLGDLGFHPKSLRDHSDLARIPFTTKSDIVPGPDNPEGPRRFILQPTTESIREQLPLTAKIPLLARRLTQGEAGLREHLMREFNPVKMLFTTGRSAASLPFFLTQYDLDILRETGRRITRVLGLVPGHDKVLSLFPFAPHLAFWQVVECANSAGVLTLNTGGGRVMGTDRIIDVMQRMEPTCVVGMPGYFYHVLRHARRQGVALGSVEKVALGGERVSAALKEKIVEILRDMGAADPRVASVFGFTEARQAWTECLGASETGFHTSFDLALLEVVDPETGVQLGEGETGELVFTTLEGRGSVLLRYRTGDIVQGGVTLAPCPGCGRTVPRITNDIRRASNVKSLAVSKVKGTLVNFNSLIRVLSERSEIEEWQVVIRKANDDPHDVDELVLYCAVRDGVDAESFRDAIQKDVQNATEIQFNEVIIEPLEDLLRRTKMETEMKEERIVDERPGQRRRPLTPKGNGDGG